VELAQGLLRLVNDQRIRFLAVGGVNTVVGFAIFAAVNEWLLRDVRFGYLAALVISYAIALVLAFYLYRRFVFHVQGNSLVDLLRFTSVYAVSIGINLVALPLLVEAGNAPPLLAQAVILIVTTLVSFVGHRYFSFRRPSAAGADQDSSGNSPMLTSGRDTRLSGQGRRIDWRRLAPTSLGSWQVLAVLVVLGFALRLAGATWGLPQALHPDERVIVGGALDLARRNSFEPSQYFRPDHVEIQLSYIAYVVFSKLFLGTSVDLGYAAQPESYLLISRLVTVGFGVAIIVLAWFIGRKINARVGFFAAAIAALLPIFVEHSHYATPDIPLTAAFMGVVLAMSHYIRSPRIPSLLFASACVSISIAIKYPGAIATVLIAVVVIFAAVRDRQLLRGLWHGLLAICAVTVFLFFISPVLFTNYQAVVKSFQNESGGHVGADGLGGVGNFLFYGELMGGVFGILMALMILLGVFDAIQRRRTVTLTWTLGIITWVILSVVTVHWERWALPMFVTPVLFGALGLARAWELAVVWKARRSIKTAVVTIASSVMFANLALPAVALDAGHLALDTRVAAQSDFEELGITAENAIFEGYTPLYPSLAYFVFGQFSFDAAGDLVPRDATKEWVVLSSCTYARFADETAFPNETKFYDAIDEQYSLEFSVDARESFNTRRSAFEPANIAHAVSDIVAYSSNEQSGCDLRAYRLNS
jgi:putative flippase GtrA